MTSQLIEVFADSLDEAVEKMRSKKEQLYFNGYITPDKPESSSDHKNDGQESDSDLDRKTSKVEVNEPKRGEFRYSEIFLEDSFDDEYDIYGWFV